MKQGWEIQKLGEVCDLLNRGISPKYLEKDGVCVLNQKCIRNHCVSYHESRRHDSALKPVSPERFIKLGDVLVNSTGTGTLGRVAQIREMPLEPTTVDSHVTIVRPKDSLFYSDFFGYMLILIEEKIKEAGEGCGGQTELARSVLAEKFLVQYPKSLPEQQRIVTILDEAFDAIANAKANAEQNLKNAKELFESYLQGVFENKGEDWQERRVQDIAKIVNGYAFASKDFQSTNTIKSIKITNVGVKEFVEETDNYLPEKFKDTLKEFQVKEGNIVIALTRTIIAAGLKVAVVPESYDGALINQRVAALVPNEKLINQRFLYNFLTTDGVSKYVFAHVNTLMQPNLSINDLKNMLVPCPPFKEQQTIVQKLDALSVETKRLEVIYQQKIADLEELKKIVLQKAFSGELTTSKSN